MASMNYAPDSSDDAKVDVEPSVEPEGTHTPTGGKGPSKRTIVTIAVCAGLAVVVAVGAHLLSQGTASSDDVTDVPARSDVVYSVETSDAEKSSDASASTSTSTDASTSTVDRVSFATHVTDDAPSASSTYRSKYGDMENTIIDMLTAGTWSVDDETATFTDTKVSGTYSNGDYAIFDASSLGYGSYVFTIIDSDGNAWLSEITTGTNADGGTAVTLSCEMVATDIMTRE